MEKFQVGILGFYQTIKLYICSMIIFVFRFHCILVFHSTRYAEKIKRTNLVGEINSQEGSWELKQHTSMIWDDNVVKSLVINGHTTCTAIFLYLFTSIYAMWMDTNMWEYICYKAMYPEAYGNYTQWWPLYEKIRGPIWKAGGWETNLIFRLLILY